MSKPQLRVYLPIPDLQRQFAAFLSSPLPARGYVPLEGTNSLFIEIAPGLSIERMLDLALKKEPGVEPGMLAVERQFGMLEIHSDDTQALDRAGKAMLDWLETDADAQIPPELMFSDIIEDISDRHAVMINRAKQASMLLPGQSLLIMEVTPALYGAYLANAAEKAEPGNVLVDCRLIGASGRIYVSGTPERLARTRKAVEAGIKTLSRPKAASTGKS
ncbi:hypothetical protein [Chachezhania sediminis]|uniref:hypothetical protein n=1 Tax=Chachezhania sediminis TaxID=2599291 RepID=UPI0018EEDA59|nr:hypothetical protein [Chachezhania sediminis]